MKMYKKGFQNLQKLQLFIKNGYKIETNGPRNMTLGLKIAPKNSQIRVQWTLNLHRSQLLPKYGVLALDLPKTSLFRKSIEI